MYTQVRRSRFMTTLQQRINNLSQGRTTVCSLQRFCFETRTAPFHLRSCSATTESTAECTLRYLADSKQALKFSKRYPDGLSQGHMNATCTHLGHSVAVPPPHTIVSNRSYSGAKINHDRRGPRVSVPPFGRAFQKRGQRRYKHHGAYGVDLQGVPQPLSVHSAQGSLRPRSILAVS